MNLLCFHLGKSLFVQVIRKMSVRRLQMSLKVETPCLILFVRSCLRKSALTFC